MEDEIQVGRGRLQAKMCRVRWTQIWRIARSWLHKGGDAGRLHLACLMGAMVLPSSVKLKTLNLKDNCIGDAGAEALAIALPRPGSLHYFSLGGNSTFGH